MENIPSPIFDLVNQKDFEALTTQEKVKVLAYLSEEEYNELRQGVLLSEALVFNEQQIPSNDAQKELLLHRLKQKHNAFMWWQTPVALWKVAASFLLFGLMGYFYLHTKTGQNNKSLLAQTDTVYLEKLLPAEKIYDTVYLKQTVSAVKHEKPKQQAASYETPQNQQSVEDNALPNVNNLNLLSVSDYDKAINNKKGKSIKDDTLITMIGFVTL
ncbi:MAG: hypothetical protein V4538_02710 [Bacteroidota bacterium]